MIFGITSNDVKKRIGLGLSLARAHLKIKIEDSYLGFLWYSLNPLVTFLVLLFVFSKNLGCNIPNYPLYLLVGIIMFNMFQTVTYEAALILGGEFLLMKAVKIPHEVFVIAIIFKDSLSHFFELLILFIIFLFLRIPVTGILFYPVLFILFCVFLIGVSLGLFTFRIFIKDIENIWAFLSRLLWFITPIFYAPQQYGKFMYVNLLNPLFYFITIAREVIVYQRWPSGMLILGALGYSLLSLGVGLMVFNRFKSKFNELL
jgi:ABC-2 type transport system permease protein